MLIVCDSFTRLWVELFLAVKELGMAGLFTKGIEIENPG